MGHSDGNACNEKKKTFKNILFKDWQRDLMYNRRICYKNIDDFFKTKLYVLNCTDILFCVETGLIKGHGFC